MTMASFLVLNSTRANNEVTALMAQDSMNMVTMALHNPPVPAPPMAVRMFLVCRTSRITIIRVRRMLSGSEIEKYGIVAQSLLSSCVVSW